MSLEDELADALEGIMRGASDDVMALIAEALGEVTDDTDYFEVAVNSRAFQLKVNEILKRAQNQGNAEIDKAFAGIDDDRMSWATPFYAAAGVAAAGSAIKDEIVSKGALEAKKSLKSLTDSNVVGVFQGDKLVSTRTAYIRAVNDAVASVRAGQEAYQSSVIRSVRSLVDSGLREVPKLATKSPTTGKVRTQELYSAVRRDVMSQFRESVHEYDLELGREFGADGWEVSAHALCAEDHLQYQGEQYSNKEMDNIQSDLPRPLQYGSNCHHQLIPVILGESFIYSPKDIIEMRRYSTEKVTITGLNGQQRTMSRYDASQYLRSLENNTRRYNTEKKLDKIAGVQSTAGKMEKHTREVARQLCKDTGLQYRPDMMRASV